MNKKHLFLLTLIIAVSTILQTKFALTDSWTFDEPNHIKSGLEWIQTGVSPSDPFNPPLSKLGFGIIQIFAINPFNHPHLLPARILNITISQIFLLILFFYCRKKSSSKTALIATTLLAFEPNYLAHSHLATTEIYSLLTYFLVVVSLQAQINHPSSSNRLLFWLSLALLTSTKTVLIPAVIIFYLLTNKINLTKLKSLFSPQPILLFVFTIWAIYGFNISSPHHPIPPIPLGSFIKTTASMFNFVFNPKYHQTRQLIFFSQTRGVGWYLYPLVSFLLKTSPLLLTFGLYSFIKNKSSFALKAVLSIFILVSLGRYSTGVRHLLPAYPFMALSIANLIHSKSKLTILILVFSFIIAFSTLDPIAYFNPIIGTKTSSLIISDSNLDWGQNLLRLKQSYPHPIDYLVSTSPQDPIVFNLYTNPLPPQDQLTLTSLKGKTVAISHTRFYTTGLYQHPLFAQKEYTHAANHTFLIFKF